MKRVVVLVVVILSLFLVGCGVQRGVQEVEKIITEPQIEYVVVTATPEPTPTITPIMYGTHTKIGCVLAVQLNDTPIMVECLDNGYWDETVFFSSCNTEWELLDVSEDIASDVIFSTYNEKYAPGTVGWTLNICLEHGWDNWK